MVLCFLMIVNTLLLFFLSSSTIALPQFPYNYVELLRPGAPKMYPFQKDVKEKPIFLNSVYQKRVGEELFHSDFLEQLWKQSQLEAQLNQRIHENAVKGKPVGEQPPTVPGHHLSMGMQAQSGMKPHSVGMAGPGPGAMTTPGSGSMAAPHPGTMAAPRPGAMGAPSSGPMSTSGGMKTQSQSSMASSTKTAQSGQANSMKPTPAPSPPTTTPFRLIDQIEVTDENIFLVAAMAIVAILARARGVDVLFYGPTIGKRSVENELSNDVSTEILLKGVKLGANNSNNQCIQRAACEVPEKAELFAKVLEIMSWMVDVGFDWITVSPEYILSITGRLREGLVQTNECDQLFSCQELSFPAKVELSSCFNCTSEMPDG